MSKSRSIIAAIALLSAGCALAAETDGEGSPEHPAKVKVAADMRFDFDRSKTEGSRAEAGFHGRYLNLKIDGSINEQLSFSLRQRLNKFGDMKNEVFGATDWVYLSYSPTPAWTFSGGKQVVAVGGYEYDRNPIDIYFSSMYWRNIACYQFGVSAARHFADGRQTLMAQVCNSPYQPIGENCFAYNLLWTGSMGPVSTIWSANLLEYARTRFGTTLSLGTKYDFGAGYVELDLMNRYWGGRQFWLRDYSVITKVCASIGKFDIFAKGGYERYSAVPASHRTVDEPFYGAGVEYFPIAGSRNLRLHLVADMTHDYITGARTTQIGAGLMWRVTLLSAER